MAEPGHCIDCVHFRPYLKANKDDTHRGFCKRYPPHPFYKYPEVVSDNGCGEFSKKEE